MGTARTDTAKADRRRALFAAHSRVQALKIVDDALAGRGQTALDAEAIDFLRDVARRLRSDPPIYVTRRLAFALQKYARLCTCGKVATRVVGLHGFCDGCVAARRHAKYLAKKRRRIERGAAVYDRARTLRDTHDLGSEHLRLLKRHR